jgi:MFS transporter, DHA1 family, multidrug resistance protein
VMIAPLLVGFGFLGLVIPTTSVMALDHHGEIAGAASALMGTLQMVSGAVIIAVMGRFVDGTARPMLAGIAVMSLVTLATTLWTLRGQHAVPATAV